ncbi:hypothetical protein CRE_07611 [Caenorhabditis remanei]|uniref:Uncharacterized protein n=1 Tax=Caenorhabditis remanei TaxID=31234 RepID=E3MP83_CAERE|nr:hypothetical protein CRE_07611 [Caenorhabditis remanei]
MTTNEQVQESLLIGWKNEEVERMRVKNREQRAQMDSLKNRIVQLEGDNNQLITERDQTATNYQEQMKEKDEEIKRVREAAALEESRLTNELERITSQCTELLERSERSKKEEDAARKVLEQERETAMENLREKNERLEKEKKELARGYSFERRSTIDGEINKLKETVRTRDETINNQKTELFHIEQQLEEMNETKEKMKRMEEQAEKFKQFGVQHRALVEKFDSCVASTSSTGPPKDDKDDKEPKIQDPHPKQISGGIWTVGNVRMVTAADLDYLKVATKPHRQSLSRSAVKQDCQGPEIEVSSSKMNGFNRFLGAMSNGQNGQSRMLQDFPFTKFKLETSRSWTSSPTKADAPNTADDGHQQHHSGELGNPPMLNAGGFLPHFPPHIPQNLVPLLMALNRIRGINLLRQSPGASPPEVAARN